MNRLIRRWDAEADGDLRICRHRGVAYQADMSRPIAYDEKYLNHYRAFAGSPVETALHAGRVALVERHAKPGARVFDVGVGSGAFVTAAAAAGFSARGFDINPHAVSWLKERDAYAADATGFDAVTFWDSLEHMDEPEVALRKIEKGALVFVAIPIFEDLGCIRASRHYKPREHFYHFTTQGFIDWMAIYGFRLLEVSNHETDAGRESIGAFAFCRDLPDYDDHIRLYADMHASRHYGNSATELHLGAAAGVVRAMQPRAILDYGCGRSDLVAHFWNDGARRIARYDPAIPPIRRMPEGAFDLVLACDVMEHIPMASVDRVLGEIKGKSEAAFFTISTKLARAKLPDGRNSHVTLLRHSEWVRWIKDYFQKVETLPETSEHELVLLAGYRAIAQRRAA